MVCLIFGSQRSNMEKYYQKFGLIEREMKFKKNF